MPSHSVQSMLQGTVTRAFESSAAAPATQQTACAGIHAWITADGKVPMEHAREMLHTQDAILLEALEQYPDTPLHLLSGEDELSRPGLDYTAAVWRNDFHHVFIKPIGTKPACGTSPLKTSCVGYFQLPAGAMEAARKKCASAAEEERALRRGLDEALKRVDELGSLGAMLSMVDDAIRHVESLCLYIDDEFFAVVERYTNLIRASGDGSLFTDLIDVALDEWSERERLLVISLAALYRSGRSVRFEEFSGTDLSAKKLLRRLDELARDYNLGLPSALEAPHRVLEVADALGKVAFNCAPRGLFRYRYVNGITYLKTERVVVREWSDDSLAGVSERLVDLYRTVNPCAAVPDSAQAFFTDLTEKLLQDTTLDLSEWMASTPAVQPIEVLIQEIVASAVMRVGADYGMSSSIRDPSILCQPTHEALLENVLGLTVKDFYNCVSARPGIAADLTEARRRSIYEAVQRRMQFNRWHFIAGNFAATEVPRSRHYFYPPVLPDIGDWVDQQHKGHKNSSVRFSIRSPGPDMHQPPLMIAGHPYRGFYDVRAVRMEGPKFSLEDVYAVRRHSVWMGLVWRCLVAAAEKGATQRPLIRGFQVGNGFEVPARTPAVRQVPDRSDHAAGPGAARSIRTPAQLIAQGLSASEEQPVLEKVCEEFSLAITKEVVEMINPTDIRDPVRLQFVPQEHELHTLQNELHDPIGDDRYTPVPGITHRYPDRVLLKPLHVCPVYCRFCFRREKVGAGGEGNLSPAQLEAALDYIRQHEEIWEVILSGGDPMILSPRKLKAITTALRDVPHVKVLRIHTRVPVVDPGRVDDEMIAALKCFAPVHIVLHCNHANELRERQQAAIARLVDAGIPMVSQSVLLRGVNNSVEALTQLFRRLVENRVKPYYLHHGDLARGTSHFRTSLSEGQALMRGLRGNVSGMCQPQYILDIPGGWGKVPVGPNYVEVSQGRTIVEDYRGGRHDYADRG
jgi:lysine 2,3-aminomutase